MSLEDRFWLVLIVVSTAECIRQYWLLMKALAIPDEWTNVVRDYNTPQEGDHVADKDRP